MRRRHSPRGSHGLHPLPRARLHLPKPLRSPLHSPALPRYSARTRSALSPASATAAPPVEFAAGAPPRPAIKRTQLRPPLRHLVLAVVTPLSQGRAFFALRRRQPWRRRARPPWNASFFPSSTLPSCLLAFATSLRTPCARPLALTRSATTAGPLVEPRRRGVSTPAWPLRLGRAGPSGRGPKPRARPPLPFARSERAECGRGPDGFHGPAQ